MVKENKESLMRWLNSCNTDTPNPNPAEMWGFFMRKFCHNACADRVIMNGPSLYYRPLKIYHQACALILKKKSFKKIW